MTTITTRSGKGSPLTNDEVDANFTNLNDDKIEASGDSMTGNLSFGDNDKAIFGAGSDLQIYHDGSNSWINDAGTGNLVISAGDLRIEDKSGNRYIQGSGNTTYLYHTGVVKFATTSTGIDVTGTVTADGLTVDGNVVVNSNNLEVSSTTPNIRLTETDVTDENTQIIQAGGTMRIRSASDNYATATERMRIDHSTGDISFYNSAGTSTDFYWDASTSRLGLGETNPSAQLHIKGNANANMILEAGSATDANFIYFGDSDGLFRGGFKYDHSADSLGIYSSGLSTADITLDSSGRLGIGTDSPSTKLDIEGTTSGNLLNLYNNLNASNSETGILFKDRNVVAGGNDAARVYSARDGSNNRFDLVFETADSGTLSEGLRIDHDGNVGISNTNPSYDLHIGDGTSDVTLALQSDNSGNTRINLGDATNASAGSIVYANSTNKFTFTRGGANAYEVDGTHKWYTSGGSRAMDLDSSGTLLVGTTNDAPHTTTVPGQAGFALLDAGMLRLGRNENPALHVNRITGDGLLAMWYRNGANVGNISVTSTTTTYNTSSDQRLKDNIVDAPSASDDIDAIQVRSFDWKADGSHQKYGMVAQELQTVAPDAVTEGETEEDMMGVDYSKLVPMLVKEIQSLRARVAQLEGAN